MLASHLDPNADGASAPAEIIDHLAVPTGSRPLWVPQPGDGILDLGCGPRLYVSGWRRAGFQVTWCGFIGELHRLCHCTAPREEARHLNTAARISSDLDHQGMHRRRWNSPAIIAPFLPISGRSSLANVRAALWPASLFCLGRDHRVPAPEAWLEKQLDAAPAGLLEARSAPGSGQGFAYPDDSYLRLNHRHPRRREPQLLPQLVPGFHPRKLSAPTDCRRLRGRKPLFPPGPAFTLYPRLWVGSASSR